MSDTPRTDDARRQYQAAIWQGRAATTIETVDIEFARELERELNELVETFTLSMPSSANDETLNWI
jgi:hypothetical protein